MYRKRAWQCTLPASGTSSRPKPVSQVRLGFAYRPEPLSSALIGEIIGLARCAMAEDKHPGITMHKLPVGGGFMGWLFAIGSSLIFLVGFPTLWYFVALAFLLGIGIAAFLRIVKDHRSQTNKPLSILTEEEKPAQAIPDRNRRSSLMQV